MPFWARPVTTASALAACSQYPQSRASEPNVSNLCVTQLTALPRSRSLNAVLFAEEYLAMRPSTSRFSSAGARISPYSNVKCTSVGTSSNQGCLFLIGPNHSRTIRDDMQNQN